MTALVVAVEIRAGDRRVWRRSEEIAPESLRLTVSVPFDRGTRVRIRFRLPGGAPIETDAVVHDEHGLTLSPAPPEQAAIEAYLREEEES